MQNEVMRTTGRAWPFLEPAMVPDYARTFHVVLPAAAAGTFVAYRKGQIIRQKDDGSNEWAKVGTAGYTGPAAIIKHSMLINDAGKHQLTEEGGWDSHREAFEGSVDAYYQGYFKTQDLTGAGGTNEVQTLTINANVDGGTFTLSQFGYTTAPIAYNATSAQVKAAMLAAIPVLASADVAVAGNGPHTFTYSGAYAGSNVPAIAVDPAGLTDGGIPETTGTAVVETTPGAALLTGVGRIVRGTSANGILQLGVGAPA